MTDSLFDPNGNNEPQFDDSKDYHSELVGEGKKFKDDAALAKGKAHSDHHIEILERRLDDLRTDYEKVLNESKTQAKLQELIDNMETRGKQRDDTNDNTKDVSDEHRPDFDPQEIEKMISTKLQEAEVRKRESDNIRKAEDRLKEQFGPRFWSSVDEKANNLGLTREDVISMAKKSPEAMFNTLGLNQQKNTNDDVTLPRSNTRDPNFNMGSKKRTWAYYQELKKSNPKVYYDPKTAVQMDRDAITLGEAFKDGDYFRFGSE